VPPWIETEKTHGIIGTPLVDTHARFHMTASYGDTLQIHTSVAEYRHKRFVQRYRVLRGEDLIMECDEVRVFAARREGSDTGIRALPIPADFMALCE
jgi:4-hydroxybenzoyl-CoA thioesterase